MRDEGKYCSLLFLHVSAAKKPNIDRLAAPGMLVRNNFCVNCICGPSRAVNPHRKAQSTKWFHGQWG